MKPCFNKFYHTSSAAFFKHLQHMYFTKEHQVSHHKFLMTKQRGWQWIPWATANITARNNAVSPTKPTKMYSVFFCSIQNRFTILIICAESVLPLSADRKSGASKSANIKRTLQHFTLLACKYNRLIYPIFRTASKHLGLNSRDLSHTVPINHCFSSPRTCRNTSRCSKTAKSL